MNKGIKRLPPTDAPWTLKELDDAKIHITEQDREIERLQQLNRDIVERYSEAAEKAEAELEVERNFWLDVAKRKDYQCRHRKWALEQCRSWQRNFCFYKDDAVRFHSDRADKAEAGVEARQHSYNIAERKTETAEAEIERLLTDNAHKDHDLFQTEKRVKELRRYNEVLKSQRADVYNEGVEDGQREAGAELKAEKTRIAEYREMVAGYRKQRDAAEADNRRLQERVRELEETGEALWPHIHDEDMEGETIFEKAWMHFEAVLFFGREKILQALQHKERE